MKRKYWLLVSDDGYVEVHYTRDDARFSKKSWEGAEYFKDALNCKYRIKRLEIEF